MPTLTATETRSKLFRLINEAAESANAVNALVYTVGHDVVFGKGEYAPATVSGLQLLAHELVHSVQQSKQSTWLRAESSRQRRNSKIIRLLPYNLLPEQAASMQSSML